MFVCEILTGEHQIPALLMDVSRRKVETKYKSSVSTFHQGGDLLVAATHVEQEEDHF